MLADDKLPNYEQQMSLFEYSIFIKQTKHSIGLNKTTLFHQKWSIFLSSADCPIFTRIPSSLSLTLSVHYLLTLYVYFFFVNTFFIKKERSFSISFCKQYMQPHVSAKENS